MLERGKHLLKEKEDKNKRHIIVNPSDYLSDEEDGYTQEVRDSIDEELMCLTPEKSLKLEDLTRGIKKNHLISKKGKKKRVA